MLALTLDSTNQVVLDGGITIQLPDSVKAGQVRICIDAPKPQKSEGKEDITLHPKILLSYGYRG